MAYFAACAAAAAFLKPRTHETWRAAVLSAAVAAAILLIAQISPLIARAWMGHAYLGAGYWIPGLMVAHRQPGGFEAWLVGSDEWWRRRQVPLPPLAAVVVELSYLFCYAIVPAGFLAVYVAGSRPDLDRYWTAVLVSGFACYGTLPWLIARPPRVIGDGPEASAPTRSLDAPRTLAVRRVNVLILTRVSHGLVTFPSGHVSVSAAAALIVWDVAPVVGAAMLIISAGIAAGAITGRYHYAIDVVLGALIGIGAALVV